MKKRIQKIKIQTCPEFSGSAVIRDGECKQWYRPGMEPKTVTKTCGIHPLTIPTATAALKGCSQAKLQEIIREILTPDLFYSWFRFLWDGQEMITVYAEMTIAIGEARERRVQMGPSAKEPEATFESPLAADNALSTSEFKTAFQLCKDFRKRRIIKRVMTADILRWWFRSLPFVQMSAIFELASTEIREKKQIEDRSLAKDIGSVATPGQPSAGRFRDN